MPTKLVRVAASQLNHGRKIMLKALIALCVMLLPGAAWAGSTCYTIGTTVYCNGTGDNAGASSSGYSIGKNQYYNGQDAHGRNWSLSCYYIGNTRYCN
jgi:hypothetical protein